MPFHSIPFQSIPCHAPTATVPTGWLAGCLDQRAAHAHKDRGQGGEEGRGGRSRRGAREDPPTHSPSLRLSPALSAACSQHEQQREKTCARPRWSSTSCRVHFAVAAATPRSATTAHCAVRNRISHPSPLAACHSNKSLRPGGLWGHTETQPLRPTHRTQAHTSHSAQRSEAHRRRKRNDVTRHDTTPDARDGVSPHTDPLACAALPTPAHSRLHARPPARQPAATQMACRSVGPARSLRSLRHRPTPRLPTRATLVRRCYCPASCYSLPIAVRWTARSCLQRQADVRFQH